MRGSARSVEVKASSERRFNHELHSALEQMVQHAACSSVSILPAMMEVEVTFCIVLHRQRYREELVCLSVEFVEAVVVYIVQA